MEIARNKSFNLILMDVRMPVMDGYAAAKNIRKLPGYHDTHIVALTADVSQKVKNEVKTGLFDEVLVKPVEPDELLHMLYRFAEKVKDAGQSGSETEADQGELQIDFEKVHDYMDNNEQSVRKFLKKTLLEFEGIKSRFAAAMNSGDLNTLDEDYHKSRWVFDLLGLEPLNRHFRYSLDLLKNGSDDKELLQAEETGEMLIASVIERLKNEGF